jgi:ClpP class serine protease
MQTRVDDYYGMFLDAVARGRGVSAAKVRAGFGEGRVLGAKQAVALGMADRIATMEQTLARLDATKFKSCRRRPLRAPPVPRIRSRPLKHKFRRQPRERRRK